MAEYLIQDTTLTNLGDKIRTLNGTEDTMTPVEMGDGLDDANNEVGVQSDLIDQLMDALDGKALPDGGTIAPSGTILILENGTYDVTSYASAEVNVPSEEPTLQDKIATPSTVAQLISADDGYDGLNTVTVSAMPTAAQATPSISIDGSGLITATATQSAGYVEEGTKSATQQLTTKGATTITPSDTEQTAVSAGTYVTGDIKVGASTGRQVVTGTATLTNNTASKTSSISFAPGFNPTYALLVRVTVGDGYSGTTGRGQYMMLKNGSWTTVATNGISGYTSSYSNGTVTLSGGNGALAGSYQWVAYA